jgi:DNA (cytosine-5)-methyltransferase 1
LPIHRDRVLTLSQISTEFDRPLKLLQNWRRAGLLGEPLEGQSGETCFALKRFAMFIPELAAELRTIQTSGRPRVASLFSGCGGLDLGFRKAGFELAYANDLFMEAAWSYAENIGPIDARSIYDVPTKSVRNIDVLLAGFPCQPFSNAGSRRGVSDPRGTLFWETLRFVEHLKPKVLLFENVKGILSMHNPDGERLIDAISRELQNRGYLVSYTLLNASEFGVPQNRQRVVVVAVRRGRGVQLFDFSSIKRAQGKTIGEVIGDIPKHLTNNSHWPLSPQSKSLLRYIPEGGSWKSVPYSKLPLRLQKIRDNMERYHSPNFYRRFSRDEIMGTVTAAATPENSGIIHPTESRRYTVREIARFQTFPDTFEFHGRGIASHYRQIGNAVPPELARRIGIAIKNAYF